MAKVWLYRDGTDYPASGGPLKELPIGNLETMVDVGLSDFIGDKTPRFGHSGARARRKYQHVVVEVNDAEAAGHGWKPGFYHARSSPEEAFRALGIPFTEIF